MWCRRPTRRSPSPCIKASRQRRQGLSAIALQRTSASFILSIHQRRIVFEAPSRGEWVYNVRSPEVLKPGQWQHLVAVIEEDQGVRLYLDGKEVLHSRGPREAGRQRRAAGDRPRGLGRRPPDAPRADLLSWPHGPIKIWPRALSSEEIYAVGVESPSSACPLGEIAQLPWRTATGSHVPRRRLPRVRSWKLPFPAVLFVVL